MRLFAPPDVLAAHAEWGASCGPAALAAVLGVPVMSLRDRFPTPWTTPTTMQAALRASGRAFVVRQAFPKTAPFGLAFVQIRGKWDTAPDRAQYRHTHWIGFALENGARLIYDINAGTAGGWSHSEHWKSVVLPRIVEGHKGASGLWRVRMALEVR